MEPSYIHSNRDQNRDKIIKSLANYLYKTIEDNSDCSQGFGVFCESNFIEIKSEKCYEYIHHKNNHIQIYNIIELLTDFLNIESNMLILIMSQFHKHIKEGTLKTCNSTWRPIFISNIILASKFYFDSKFNYSRLYRAYRYIPKERLDECELQLFSIYKYRFASGDEYLLFKEELERYNIQ